MIVNGGRRDLSLNKKYITIIIVNLHTIMDLVKIIISIIFNTEAMLC